MKLLSLLLALNILVSSTGISVYTHFCKMSSHVITSVMESFCDTDPDMRACCNSFDSCRMEESDPDVQNCCETSGEFYKEDLVGHISMMGDLAPEPYFFIVQDVVLETISANAQSTLKTILFTLPEKSHGTPMSLLQVFRC